MSCIFCKIVNKKVASNIVYENQYVLAFEDVNPQAPIHILVIPKKHETEMKNLAIDKIWEAIQTVVKIKNINNKGFRVIMNWGQHGGQEIAHLHFHILADRQMLWPPG